MRARDDLEVEIPTGPVARGPVRDRRAWWAALGAGVLAVVVLGQGHGVAARAARLAGVDVSPSLATPWHEAWEAPGAVLAVYPTSVVLSGPDGTGAVARDATGGVVWGPVEQGSPCAPARGAVLCRTISATGSAGTVTLGGDPQRAVALDEAGQVTATYRPPGALSSWWFLEGSVVAVGQEQGHLVVDRWAPQGFVWRYRSSDAVVAPVSYPFSIGHGDGWLLIGGTRAVLLDLATGQEIRSKESAGRPQASTRVVATRDRSVPGLVVRGGQEVVGTIDGERRWQLPGPLWAVVDGVAVAGGVTAVDARTGTELWSAPGDGAFTDGDRIAVVGDGALTARRLHDGNVLWRVPVAGTYSGRNAAGVVIADGRTATFLAP